MFSIRILINTEKRGMSRISELRNDMNKRTFYKERKINKRRIHFLSKQNIKAPLILDIYGAFGWREQFLMIIRGHHRKEVKSTYTTSP